MKSYRDLKVYKEAYESSLEIHRVSLTFPKHEQIELGGQIRRATKSIPMNIAEGYGRDSSSAEIKRFLAMARGSCCEVSVQLDYCMDLGYLTEAQNTYFKNKYEEIGKMLTGLTKSME